MLDAASYGRVREALDRLRPLKESAMASKT